MAFADLAEHLEEVFAGAGLGYDPLLSIRHRRATQRTAEQRRRDTATGITWRSKRRREAQAAAMAQGERPWRCQRPGCCNLLPVAYHGGPPPLFCRRTCRMAKYDREATRSPDAKRRKSERRRKRA